MSRSDTEKKEKRKNSRPPWNGAKKSLGQNFLVDPNYVRKIVAALNLKGTDTVVEIGPGHGAITEYLVASEAQVIAVELDRDFVPMLRDRFASNANFSVVEADATQIEFGQFLDDRRPETKDLRQKAKVVANLPYYISTPILQHLSTHRHLFESLVLMFQKEVVDRIAAKPGDSDRGFLTVLVEAAFQVEKLFDVPPTAFKPAPKVTSSVARFVPKPVLSIDEKVFRDLVSMSFGQKRKTILNNLKAGLPDAANILERCGIDSRRRAETLTLTEWIRISEEMALRQLNA